MTLPANLNVYISVALFILGAYVFALYIGLIVWAVRDIRARSRDVLALIMVILLVGLFTVPGLLVYFLLRPHTTLAEEYERSLAEEALLSDLETTRVCPSCNRRVEPDFIHCPYCRHELRLRCQQCGHLLNTHWKVCAYCGADPDQPAAPPKAPELTTLPEPEPEQEPLSILSVDATEPEPDLEPEAHADALPDADADVDAAAAEDEREEPTLA
jgi:RNA polymerase subunit RPABC4/transcription elongation factor Spt4